jgi:hypothetical protein
MLRVLVLNPSVRAEAGRRAQQRVLASYDWDAITCQIEGEYLRVTGKAAAGEHPPITVAASMTEEIRERVA